jgi:hypothetical protein
LHIRNDSGQQMALRHSTTFGPSHLVELRSEKQNSEKELPTKKREDSYLSAGFNLGSKTGSLISNTDNLSAIEQLV